MVVLRDILYVATGSWMQNVEWPCAWGTAQEAMLERNWIWDAGREQQPFSASLCVYIFKLRSFSFILSTRDAGSAQVSGYRSARGQRKSSDTGPGIILEETVEQWCLWMLKVLHAVAQFKHAKPCQGRTNTTRCSAGLAGRTNTIWRCLCRMGGRSRQTSCVQFGVCAGIKL